jgi:amino acid adenylation domain-containing protein
LLVDDLLRAAAERAPQAQALVCAGRRLSFGGLDEAVDRVACGLFAAGVRRGDRVAIHLENGVEAVLGIFGALRAGAVFVPINPTTKAEKLGYILSDCEPVVLVSDRRTAQVAGDARARVANPPVLLLAGGVPSAAAGSEPESSFDAFLEGAPGPFGSGSRIDLDLAALIYTSGSTGQPKGVMLTHANILAATASINSYLGNTPDDVILDVLPLSFDYGLYQLFLALHSGASVVLERSFGYPALMFDVLPRERVTALPIVPMLAALLCRHDLSAWDLSSLRYITNTGAVLPPAHIATLRARLPHVRIYSMYGLTECKRVSYLDPQEIDSRPASVGKPMENVEVYVVDGEGTLCEHGTGELVVRGANVMQGYWRAPEETQRALRPGLLPGERVLYTGDIFRVDEQGFMYFQHRLDDIIKSRGQKVSPREVENVLHAASGVVEALVVGVPDAVTGEAVKGYVTLAPGAAVSEQDLLLHCSKYLEDFMVPRSIEIVAELPHNQSGKLSRRAVKAQAPQS